MSYLQRAVESDTFNEIKKKPSLRILAWRWQTFKLIFMKNIIILSILILVASCKNDNSYSEAQESEFKNTAIAYQSKYMEGSINCDYIMNSMDEQIVMSELRFDEPLQSYTYEQLKKFCPHLPNKNIIESVTEQRLLSSRHGYDFVSQTFLRSTGKDTLRETSSRIWEMKDGVWKIVQMNNSIKKDCD